MAIKIILAPMSGAESTEATLASALHVGRHLNAHVEAFHVSLDPRDSVAYMAEGMTSNIIQDIMSAVEKEGEERRERAHEQFARLSKEANAPITEGRSGAVSPRVSRQRWAARTICWRSGAGSPI